VGLLTHDTFPSHFLDLAVGVGDDPMPVQQSRRERTCILNGNSVGESITVRFRMGLFLDVNAQGVNGNPVAGIFDGGHGGYLTNKGAG
jgi:hypothetical protein